MLAFANDSGAHSAVSVTAVQKHPAWMFHLAADRKLSPYTQDLAERRQDLPELFALNGAMYWVRTDWLLRERRLVGPDTLGFPMDAQSSVDIDTPLDWHLAEILLAKRTSAVAP
jgi:CMP-N-acetylneuraminic acid synthetase